ncbi:MAG: hypothetical protein COV99_04940 [Bacteroidetes bacterium CG12_big_fil_rev_8_21_14_0_65_60_17]|nr:MAG: hypothetical protein COV99_04940 [Bacteroidetes bacterium CG12_big_fil_rev_8_21_14_0_65_60_17]
MGQQQLLLLVLGIVIVGLAVVVGIQAFSENMKKANADALVNDAVRVASEIQAWKLKPAAFGGGADETGFANLTLAKLGYDTADANNGACAAGEIKNVNGCIGISGTPGATVVLLAKSTPDSDLDNQVQLTISNTSSSGIATVVSTVDDAS